MRAFILIVLVFVFTEISWGQISQGGYPAELVQLKRANAPVVEMPVVDNIRLLKSSQTELLESNKLKPLKFAHAFDVNLSAANSGDWNRLTNGDYCWKLKIHSQGAKSINLIFDHFALPPNAKLFIYNEKENHVLGAFTSANNKSTKKFAVAPVKGDEITIQYEVPEQYLNRVDFVIKKVNHDFIGILEKNERRPLGIAAGSCNVDINCDLGADWNEVKNAVCRMIVDGVEICTGSLINNTAEDQKPFIISAAHCYDKWEYAETTVYAFNYESPFCAPLDGDPSNTISGALMRAQFDSMDFALAEMSLIPPPEYRPYFAGWDHSSNLPDSTVSIHHPQGDIKKIALDADPPTVSDFSTAYKKEGFLKIARWDQGVTEVGSSGGPLYNMDKNLIGTLTGGIASCGNPVRDYFERFHISWDYKSDSSQQLKYWLDPIKSNVQFISGKQFYSEQEYCDAFTNLNSEDNNNIVSLINSDEFAGYWGGTNSVGINEFVEKFVIEGQPELAGISLGVAKLVLENSMVNSEIEIKVYNGNKLPESLIYSRNVLLKDLVDDAMNFIGFAEPVKPNDTFFVGFELSNVQAQDSFVLFQSLRPANTDNFFYYKQNNVWRDFEETQSGYNSMVNVVELVACNVDHPINDTPVVEQPTEIYVFPNPSNDVFTIETVDPLEEENISVVNLIGQNVEVKTTKLNTYSVSVDLSGNAPGVYFIRYKTLESQGSKKISFVPW